MVPSASFFPRLPRLSAEAYPVYTQWVHRTDGLEGRLRRLCVRLSSGLCRDYCDFSHYVDAQEWHINVWYLDRSMRLREEALGDSSAYLHRFARLSVERAKAEALRVLDEIDHPNLTENIERPETGRA